MNKSQLAVLVAFFIILVTCRRVGSTPVKEIHIPNGRPIVVDGIKSPGEWDDAGMVRIAIADDGTASVRFKHDAENLYFEFEGVTHGGERLFPELLLDPNNLKTSAWQKGQWWLHVSNNLCEGDGVPNLYKVNKIFQCAHQKPGWNANNPPVVHTEVIEISVSFSKLGLKSSKGTTIGLALDLTDATGSFDQKWFYWPANARIDSPRTWGLAILE